MANWLQEEDDDDEQTTEQKTPIPYDIESKFPFPSYRPGQEEALREAARSLFVESYDNVVLNLGTGVGKSPVCVALGRMADSCFYTTPSKKLRNQLKNDKDLREYYSVLGGRDDYYCTTGGTSCNECPVRYSEDNSCRSAAGCNYWGAKEDAMTDDISVLTFAYLTLDSQIPVETEGGEQLSFDDRELLIVDEAHDLASQSCSLFAGFECSPYELLPEVFGDASEFLSEDDWLFSDVTDALDHVEANCKKFIRENEHREDPETQFEVEQCEEFKQKYSWAKTQVEGGRDWVASVEEAYPKDDLDDTLMVSVNPVDADNYLNQRVWNRADKRVLSTATMPYSQRPEKWIRQLGLNPQKTKVIQKGMPFDKENRRVYTDTTVAKMSSGGFYDNRHEVIDTLQQLAAKHSGEKGLIHTASYSRADFLANAMSDNAIKHDNSKPSDVVIDEWQQSDKQMLLSPSMMDGVDLFDNKCRWQALVKAPFPSMADSRIKFLLEERSAWGKYYETVGMKILQSVGRGVRSEDDYCSYYVLDSAFSQVFSRASMPNWFAEAVEGYSV